MNRAKFFELMGVVKASRSDPTLEAVTEKAYRDWEEQQWRKFGRLSTSFSASKVGGPPRCPRKAIYTLMNIPTAPIEPKGVAIMRQGMAAEDQIVYRWGRAGLTIAGSVPLVEGDRIHQLKIESQQHWLAGYLDSVLDLRSVDWSHVTPVDVKSKAKQKIIDFNNGFLPDDSDYKTQLMLYIWRCRELHDQMGWADMGLDPAVGGIILYVDRENPRHTFELWVPYDEEYLREALGDLESWKEAYEQGTLPPRPKDWRWTEPPCKWCDFKKDCKADIKADVSRIEDSTTIVRAKTINPKYDPDKVRSKVINRWKET